MDVVKKILIKMILKKYWNGILVLHLGKIIE